MAQQTFNLLPEWFRPHAVDPDWLLPSTDYISVDSVLTDGEPNQIVQVWVEENQLRIRTTERERWAPSVFNHGLVTFTVGSESVQLHSPSLDGAFTHILIFPAFGPEWASLYQTALDSEAGMLGATLLLDDRTQVELNPVLWRDNQVQWRGKDVTWRSTVTSVERGLRVRASGVLTGARLEGCWMRYGININSKFTFRLRGKLESVGVPRFGDEIELSDIFLNRILFRGTVRTAEIKTQDKDDFVDVVVRCIGLEDELRNRRILGHEGVAAVEQATVTDQFNYLVGLLPGYTAESDFEDDDEKATEDIRYQTVHEVILNLAARNDSIFTVTPDRIIRVLKRDTLPPGLHERVSMGEVRRLHLRADPRATRSRQLVRYGTRVSRRTIVGDGTTKSFAIVPSQVPEEYRTSTGKALNSLQGDTGLRFRASVFYDADNRFDPDAVGDVGFIPQGSLFVGGQEFSSHGIDFDRGIGFSGSEERIGDLLIRLGDVRLNEAEGYRFRLDPHIPGTSTSSRGDVDILSEESQSFDTTNRREDLDFSVDIGPGIGPILTAVTYNDTVLFLTTQRNQLTVVGFQVVGNQLIRDTRHDMNVTAFNPRTMIVLGRILHLLKRDIDVQGPDNAPGVAGISSEAYRITAEGFERLETSDREITPPQRAVWDGQRNLNWTPGGGLSATSDGNEVWFSNQESAAGGNSGLFQLQGGGIPFAFFYNIGTENRGIWLHPTNETHDAIYSVGSWDTNHSQLRRVRFQKRLSPIRTEILDTASISTNNYDRQVVGFAGYIWTVRQRSEDLVDQASSVWSFTAFQVDRHYLRLGNQVHIALSGRYRTAANRGERYTLYIIDPTIIGSSEDDLNFIPIPADVSEVTALEVNGVPDEPIGEDGNWRFDKATQKLIQSDTATTLTSSDRLLIKYIATFTAEASNPTPPLARDNIYTIPGSESLLRPRAIAVANAFLARYNELLFRMEVTLTPKIGRYFEIGTYLQFPTSLLRQYGVTEPREADQWLIENVEMEPSGEIPVYTVTVARGPYREQSADWWRRIQPTENI